MHDLYSILGVSEDDVDVYIRYGITYILREGILDLSEAWVHRPIIERFRGYTHQNAVRLQRIAVDRDDCIVFDLQLVNPDVAIQEIIDEIHAVLCELLPWPSALETDIHGVRYGFSRSVIQRLLRRIWQHIWRLYVAPSRKIRTSWAKQSVLSEIV